MTLTSNVLEFLTSLRIKKNGIKDNADIEVLKSFLHSESLRTDKEIKLGEILEGMSKTVDVIVKSTSTIYGASNFIGDKISELKIIHNNTSKEYNKDLNELLSKKFNPDLKELFNIFAEANAILKLLIKDHKYTKDNEIKFSEEMNKSYIQYVKFLGSVTEMSGGETLKKKEYYPIVDRLIKHINEGKTDIEKRDIMLKNLSKTFNNILNKHKIIQDKYDALLAQCNIIHQSIKEPAKEVIIRIIQDINIIKEEINTQTTAIHSELTKIGKVIILDEDIRKNIKDEGLLVKK